MGWSKTKAAMPSLHRSFCLGGMVPLSNTDRGVVFITVGGPHAAFTGGEEDR